MLQGVPAPTGNSGDGGASAPSPRPPPQPHGSGGAELPAGSTSEEERGRIEEGDRSSGGNRWPRQETLALIKIRSDMDVAFRDSSLKGPLWDEVSRRLAELGYHRSAKKCKEKFENVFKYHKRTKEGRTSKADGKTYRFFDQLEALEVNPVAGNHPRPPVVTAAMTSNTAAATQLPFSQAVTVPSVVIPFNITGSHQNNVNPISVAAPSVAMPAMNHVGGFPFSHPNISGSTNSDSDSSSTSSDDELPEVRRKRKRKWKDFFGKLMKEVIDKQEELQMKFLDRIEKRERERTAREEAWRMEEMAKMNREHDLLVQERSITAAKDAAVISFLQKITEQNPNSAVPQILQPPPPPPQPMQPQPQPQPQQQNPQPPPPPLAPTQVPAPPLPPQQHQAPLPALPSVNNGGSNSNSNILAPSPSRWPKAEVNALINLRTTLDMKYSDSGPKGPLWEEISTGMMKLGYNRNAKRCKEKWENINKYYKKVKESSKKRPEDSKTCPYFHQLDAIYRERATSSTTHNNPNLPETTQMAPIMAEPEQQWPLPAMVIQQQQQQQRSIDQNNEDDYDDDEEEEDEGGEYEIVPKNSSSMAAVE